MENRTKWIIGGVIAIILGGLIFLGTSVIGEVKNLQNSYEENTKAMIIFLSGINDGQDTDINGIQERLTTFDEIVVELNELIDSMNAGTRCFANTHSFSQLKTCMNY